MNHIFLEAGDDSILCEEEVTATTQVQSAETAVANNGQGSCPKCWERLGILREGEDWL